MITALDVANIGTDAAEVEWKFHTNPAQSVRIWTQKHPDGHFFYEEQSVQENRPCLLGLQDQWQLDQMLKHGKNSAIMLDTTFGTNSSKVRPLKSLVTWFVTTAEVLTFVSMQFPLTTCLVFDQHQHGIPVAWVLTGAKGERKDNIVKC